MEILLEGIHQSFTICFQFKRIATNLFKFNMGRNNKRMTGPKKLQLYAKANEIFGSVESINLQLVHLGLQPVQTMEEAIDKIATMWLNISDFVNGKLKSFKNKFQLIGYTIRQRKYFPKKEAKAAGLSALLIKMSL